MSFKIKQRDLDTMTDRIANECANWEDVVWILADYLPYDVLEAIAVWDEVNSVDMTMRNLSELAAGHVVEDNYSVEWMKLDDGTFEVYVDPTNNPILEGITLGVPVIYLRGPLHVVGY